jgi:polar amino acid transport system substrate-binding protein
MSKRFGTFAVSLVLIAATSGCGSSEEGTSSSEGLEELIPGSSISAPLPKSVESAGVLNVGVRCDYPPFGSTDSDGNHVGIEIDMVHALAQYAFDDPDAVKLTCVTSANRIPYLTTKKIDMIVASMAYTTERAQEVLYADQTYYTYFVEFMAPEDGAKTFADLDGGTVTTVNGGVYEPWLAECLPHTEVLGFDTAEDSYSALQAGRADAMVHDNTLLANLLANSPDLGVSDEHIIPGYIGAAVRTGEDEMAAWLSEAIASLTSSDFYQKSLERNVENETVRAELSKSFPSDDSEMPTVGPDVSPSESCDTGQ